MKTETNAYLTFALSDEKFAIPVDNVQEVVEFSHVTKIPNAPNYMLGIINLRGRVLPLLDTRLKLGLTPTTITSKSRIMVLELQTNDNKDFHIGAMVDVAREVVEINPEDIHDAPDFENLKTSAPILGIVNDQGDITMIMDIAKVFSVTEILELDTLITA